MPYEALLRLSNLGFQIAMCDVMKPGSSQARIKSFPEQPTSTTVMPPVNALRGIYRALKA